MAREVWSRFAFQLEGRRGSWKYAAIFPADSEVNIRLSFNIGASVFISHWSAEGLTVGVALSPAAGKRVWSRFRTKICRREQRGRYKTESRPFFS